MTNQFDEKTEDAFKRVFGDFPRFPNHRFPLPAPGSDADKVFSKSSAEAIKHGTSFVKFENGSIINLDRSQVIKGE